MPSPTRVAFPAETPSTGAEITSTSASRALWHLDWSSELPWTFGDVTVEASTFAGATPFVERHYAEIFRAGGLDRRFFDDAPTPAKARFCASMDVFLIRRSGAVVGTLMAHPTDWSTYYVRSVALLPEARDHDVATRIASSLEAPLRAAGVERLEAEVSPGNAPMIQILGGLGWLVTATVNSERWGTLLRFTRFLDEDAEAAFVRSFCALHVRPRPRAAPAAAHHHRRKEDLVKKFARMSL